MPKRTHSAAAAGWTEDNEAERGSKRSRSDDAGDASAAPAGEASSASSGAPLKVTVEDSFTDTEWSAMTTFDGLSSHVGDKVSRGQQGWLGGLGGAVATPAVARGRFISPGDRVGGIARHPFIHPSHPIPVVPSRAFACR